jgi:hypothetical protein
VIWRKLAMVIVAVLLLPTAASAKEVTKIIVVGANGRSVNLGSGWSLYNQIRPANSTPVTAPGGPYFFVYPLMEAGVPMEPARYYPGSQIGCWSWSLAPEGCLASGQLPASWSGTANLTLFSVEPTTLISLSHHGARYTLPSNASVAVELTLLRTRLARPAPTSPCRWRLLAAWQGPAAAARPRSLCLRAKGLSAGGWLFPLSRQVVWMLHVVG